jgi:RNA polymerase sigma-70 factor, ECF subfamily
MADARLFLHPSLQAAERGGACSAQRLRALVDEHFAFVWRSLRRLGVADEAVDDAAQQVWIVASRRLDSIERGKEAAFLFGVAIRVAADARRARRRRREEPTPEHGLERIDASPGPDELVDGQRARQRLDDALGALPMDLRAVLVLSELEGCSGPEIARLLEIPLGTVASRLRRARELFVESVRRLGEATSADDGGRR